MSALELEYLSAKDVQSLTGITVASLERWRWKGTPDGAGPPYIKLQRRVMYPRDELNTWLRAQMRKSAGK